MAVARELKHHVPAGEADPQVFVRRLTQELAVGEIHLPSFPDIAVRVQQVLENPAATPARVALVVGSDAALAARILRLANSAFLNPSATRIKDLQLALTRLGHQLVRCTAVSFALQQMQFGSREAELKSRLQEIWRDGALVAALAYVLARETRAANPDQALVTGLMHNIGQLYIAVTAPRRDKAGAQDEAWANVVRDWHPRIARSILKHWEFPAAIVAAVGGQDSWDRDNQGEADLTDILIAATALAPCVFQRDLLAGTVTVVPTFQRLRLDAADCTRLLAASAQQIKSLQAALSP